MSEKNSVCAGEVKNDYKPSLASLRMLEKVPDFFRAMEPAGESGLPETSLFLNKLAKELFRDNDDPGEGVREPPGGTSGINHTVFFIKLNSDRRALAREQEKHASLFFENSFSDVTHHY